VCTAVLGPVAARQHYGGALAWSVIITAQAIGFITGSLIAMRLRPAFPLLAATVITFGVVPPFFLLAFHAPVWLVAASMLAVGVSIDVYEVLWLTAVQEHIPGDKHCSPDPSASYQRDRNPHTATKPHRIPRRSRPPPSCQHD
jgi:hypothetical protein